MKKLKDGPSELNFFNDAFFDKFLSNSRSNGTTGDINFMRIVDAWGISCTVGHHPASSEQIGAAKLCLIN